MGLSEYQTRGKRYQHGGVRCMRRCIRWVCNRGLGWCRALTIAFLLEPFLALLPSAVHPQFAHAYKRSELLVTEVVCW